MPGACRVRPCAAGAELDVAAVGENDPVHLALVPMTSEAPGTSRWRTCPLHPDGSPAGPETVVDAAGLRALECDHPRWLMDSVARVYPALLAAGVTVERCHDVTSTERILLGREGQFSEPSSAAAVHARVSGLPVPRDPRADPDPSQVGDQPVLFDAGSTAAPTVDPIRALRTALPDQWSRIGADNPLRLLVAAESTSWLAAAEMGHLGLPWDVAEHDRLLTSALGARPAAGTRPSKLLALADRISQTFGFPVNPDSTVDLRNAFRRLGFDIESTRSWLLRGLDHPVVQPVLEYKELSRLYTANGWNWVAEWVRNGRLHSEFLPGGVVSGRWATGGGGGLQIPRAIRAAARALPGYRLVVADAAQLEPRVLAAVSGDLALQAISARGDLYQGLAADGFGGDRGRAKLAMLGAMYGQTSGEAGRLVASLRSRYPTAMDFLEGAARRGEAGAVVQSVLGRRSPRPSDAWHAVVAAGSDPTSGSAAERRAREYSKSWGRFTRNFVVQASAADWASVWLSALRKQLRSVPGAEMVFFQHDELVVHTPTGSAASVAELARNAAEQASDLVFPGSRVSTPVRPLIVGSYADAK